MAEKISVNISGQDYAQKDVKLYIHQTLGAHHTFDLHVSLEDRDSNFINVLKKKTNELLGKPINVSYSGQTFKGLVTSLSLDRFNRQDNILVIKGESDTITLDGNAETQSQYKKSLKEIIDKALDNYPGAKEIVPKHTEKIHYQVQYKESDFNFLARMAIKYGEWMFHDGEKLYFGKKPSSKSEIELSFGVNLRKLDVAVRAIPNNFRHLGYDYKKHDFLDNKALEDGMGELAQIAMGKSKSDIFKKLTTIPIHISNNKNDLKQISDVRSNIAVSEAVTISGVSYEPKIKIGGYIKIVDKRIELDGGEDDYGKYIVTKIDHSFIIGANAFDYSNSFEAVPKEIQTPPIKADIKSPFCEQQIAEVTDINDPDELGRVRVQFIWQKEKGEKTPWIRVSTAYAGEDRGVYIFPEIGDTVLVDFENNSPDRPYVLTGMYHGKTKPKYFHEKNYKKAIKTKGGHEILMYEEKGKEKFSIFSPKEVSVRAGAGKMAHIAKEDITIESESANITIKCPGTITIQAKNIIVKGEDSIKMDSKEITITASQELKAKGMTVEVNASTNGTIKAGTNIDIEGSAVTNIKGGIIKLN